MRRCTGFTRTHIVVWRMRESVRATVKEFLTVRSVKTMSRTVAFRATVRPTAEDSSVVGQSDYEAAT